MKKEQIRQEIERVIEFLSEKGFEVDYEPLKTKVRLDVRVGYDKIRTPKRGLSERAREILAKVRTIDIEVMANSRILHKEARTKEEFEELLGKLRVIERNAGKIKKEFDKFLREKQHAKRALLKQFHQENSYAYREARKEKEEERKSLAKGDFSLVSDKLIKEWLKKRFRLKNITILSKSMRWKAVLVAEVQHTRDWRDPWYVKNLFLAGIDDNGEEWLHWVPHEGERLSTVVPNDVGWAERILFAPGKEEEIMARQGDIALCKPESIPDVKMKVVDGEYEFIRNHVLVGKFEIYCDTRRIDSTLQEYAYMRNPYEVVLTHPSHQPLTIPPGEWVLYALPQRYKGD